MEFGILGPLLVGTSDGVVRIAGPRRRALLAVLLLHANETVTSDQLARAVWDDRPPSGSHELLPTSIMRLRRALGSEAGSRVVTRTGGYAVELDEAGLDLLRFHDLCGRAQELANAAEWRAAHEQLDAALALWRGDPLADLPAHGPLRDAIDVLAASRLHARHQRIEAGLRLGRHADLLAEIPVLTRNHPFDEHLRAQWMLALYRCGRQGEALEVYQNARRMLIEELGVDPSPPLQALHQRILTADPELSGPELPEPGAVQAGPGNPPHGRSFLPADIGDFTGRTAEIALLLSGPDPGERDGNCAVMVSAIDGMAGVGKTALAVRVGHLLSERCPDGRFFLDLQAHTDGRVPMQPTAALAVLLRAWGVPPERIPDSLAERAALWRAELAGRAVLLVLDNAAGADQVRPLIPGTNGHLVVVTSRARLTGLEGARSVSLDVLPTHDAISLFHQISGQRSIAEPEATAEVVELCGRLPLALRVAAARLRHRPAWNVAYLASRLSEQSRRLGELSTSEQALATTFALSDRYPNRDRSRMFALLGLHPGPDIDVTAAAALTDRSAAEAEQLLEDLLDAHLLEQHDPGRYTFHDLLRLYAREKSRSLDEAVRDAATARMLDHYVHTAHATAVLLSPGRHPLVVPHASAPAGTPHPHDPGTAMAWFDAEFPVLRNVLATAAEQGMRSTARKLRWALRCYCHFGGHGRELIDLQQFTLPDAPHLRNASGAVPPC